MKYEIKRLEADPFDLMCSDCTVHYIEYWKSISEDELVEMHEYLLIEDKNIPDFQKKIMMEDGMWTPTPTDYNEWLASEIKDGNIRVAQLEEV